VPFEPHLRGRSEAMLVSFNCRTKVARPLDLGLFLGRGFPEDSTNWRSTKIKD
jgi:hypothetical protein